MLVLPCKENDYKPPVRSFTLRRKGRVKGVRLIDRADLVRYIREHVEPAWQPLNDQRASPSVCRQKTEQALSWPRSARNV